MELLNRIASIHYFDRVPNSFDVQMKSRELISRLYLEVQRYDNLPIFFKCVESVQPLKDDQKLINIWYVVLPIIQTNQEMSDIQINDYFVSSSSYLEDRTKKEPGLIAKDIISKRKITKITDFIDPYLALEEDLITYQALGKAWGMNVYRRL